MREHILTYAYVCHYCADLILCNPCNVFDLPINSKNAHILLLLTPANLNFCGSLNTDIQSWPSKHKTRVTLQSRCMLTKQTWLFLLKVSLKETRRKCLWDNSLRCAIHPLTFPASLFRATVNNDHRAGDSKSFLCPRIRYCTFYALLRQMVTPNTNRMSRTPQCTFCLLHQSTGTAGAGAKTMYDMR